MNNNDKEEDCIYSYGVLVLGPSGSGKTTFCNALSQFFTAVQRKHLVINMDPANENMAYEVGVDIKELIQIEEVMNELNLGLRYSMAFIYENLDWLLRKLGKNKETYLIFDFPGQIELYLNDENLKKIVKKLQNNSINSISLTSVSLFDCLCCYDCHQYISTSILSLISQINLETPHVNVLTKIDLLKEYGKLPYRLSMYFDNDALGLMVEEMEMANNNSKEFEENVKNFEESENVKNFEESENNKTKNNSTDFMKNNSKEFEEIMKKDSKEVEENSKNSNNSTEFAKKYHKLSQKLQEIVMNENLISFFPLYITDKMSVCRLVALIDKANGFYYYKENSKEKFGDLRDVAFCFDELDQEEMMMSLEEEILDHYENQKLI